MQASGFLLILLAIGAPIRAAEEDLPPTLKAQEGLYKNHAPVRLKTITDEKEKALITAISNDYNQFPLLVFLGYVSKIRHTKGGTFQKPGGPVESWYTDHGFSATPMHMTNFFETKSGNRTKFLFVFTEYTGWPGLNNTCVVLSTSDYYVLDWRGNKQSDMLKECSFENGLLKILCERRQGGMNTYFYDIADFSISKRNEVVHTPRSKE